MEGADGEHAWRRTGIDRLAVASNALLSYVWDEWPWFFTGLKRVLYEVKRELTHLPRPQQPWHWPRHWRGWWS